MKNILIISASPRKNGNSDILCDKFMQGATVAGHKVEKIFLKDKNINYCTGCGLCTTNNYTACSQSDDMEELIQKVLQADVLVMATPVYFYTMNAQMKTFIDRCCSRYTKINNKEFYFIATCADSNKNNLNRTFDSLRGFTACLEGATEKGCLYATGVWEKGDVNNTDFINQAYNMGLNA